MLGVGQFYFDDSDRPLVEKVRSARAAYLNRVGEEPEYFEVNPNELVEGLREVDGIPVRAQRSVMKCYVFSGRQYRKGEYEVVRNEDLITETPQVKL